MISLRCISSIALIVSISLGTWAGPPAVDEALIFERSECFGKCPSFRMTLFASGDYIWEGRKYVSRLGVHRGQLPPETFSRALKQLEAARYKQFNDYYIHGQSQGCREDWTDSPSVQLLVQLPGSTKRIHHYLGCRGFAREAELVELENQLDKLLSVEGWIGAP